MGKIVNRILYLDTVPSLNRCLTMTVELCQSCLLEVAFRGFYYATELRRQRRRAESCLATGGGTVASPSCRVYRRGGAGAGEAAPAEAPYPR